MAEWKRDVGSGLVILVPLLVTLYAAMWLFLLIAGLPLVDVIENPLARVAVALSVLVLAIALTGVAMRTAAGTHDYVQHV
ncbi:MAG: hypothetical protein IH969_10840 [Candidatus Krumholzibacteriota bacterium]|nr:hypothetical protein [Candidatus Krumholzibacteriota bacterium]